MKLLTQLYFCVESDKEGVFDIALKLRCIQGYIVMKLVPMKLIFLVGNVLERLFRN